MKCCDFAAVGCGLCGLSKRHDGHLHILDDLTTLVNSCDHFVCSKCLSLSLAAFQSGDLLNGLH